MKIHRLLTVGILGGVLLAGTAFAQNIDTNTTSTTIGSTQFGTLLSPTELQTIMQSSVALNCDANRVCTPDNDGTNTAFVRVDQLPGTFTDSPTGTVSDNPNFACGPTPGDGNACNLNMGFNVGGVPVPGQVAQTAPDFTGRQLVGAINTDIDLGGAGTAGMPEGFMRFTMNPSDGAATIDQFIDHTIDLGGGSLMVFQQRDATIGTGNTIPDLAMSDPVNNPLILEDFIAFNTRDSALPVTGMVSRLILAQAGDPVGGFGGLNLDVQVEFPGSGPGSGFPVPGTFVTPGLNTGIDPVGGAFGPEFNGFAFP